MAQSIVVRKVDRLRDKFFCKRNGGVKRRKIIGDEGKQR
jgi:hypothetical protein